MPYLDLDPKELLGYMDRTLMLNIGIFAESRNRLKNLVMFMMECEDNRYDENLSYVQQVVMPAVDAYIEYFVRMEEKNVSMMETE